MNIKDYLKKFKPDELTSKGILYTKSYELKGKSIESLINLMKEQNIQRLEYPEREWYLEIRDDEIYFKNPYPYPREIIEGNIIDLDKLGSVFSDQNKYINPHYSKDKYPNTVKELLEKEDLTTDELIDNQNILDSLSLSVYVNEDISKPENRLNVALFGLFLIDDFRKWFLAQLKLDLNSVIFPPINKSGYRPDFEIVNDKNETIGYVEVELDEDSSQLEKYKNTYNCPVIPLWGKTNKDGYISLFDIYKKINEMKEKPFSSQSLKNMAVFEILFYNHVINSVKSGKSQIISDEMRNSPFIKDLFKFFGKENILENIPVEREKLMINTQKEQGYSIRIYSPKAANSISLIYRSKGSTDLHIASLKKLNKYLEYQKRKNNEFAQVIADLGAKEIFETESETVKLSVKKIEEKCNKIFKAIEKL